MERDERIFWFKNLPPLEDRIEHDHQITAQSDEVQYDYLRRNELWGQCSASLHKNLERRLIQEVERQGGHCAHVVEERVTPKVNHQQCSFHLEGRYVYVLYLAPKAEA